MEIGIVPGINGCSFYLGGRLCYVFNKRIFSFRFTVDVYAGAKALRSTPKFIVKKVASMFRLAYAMIGAGKEIASIKAVSASRRHFQCRVGATIYDIYGHRNETCSIYRNDIQHACWNLKMDSSAKPYTLKIISDAGSDIELLIFFYIVSSLFPIKNDSKGIIENLATNLFEARKPNPNWQPK